MREEFMQWYFVRTGNNSAVRSSGKIDYNEEFSFDRGNVSLTVVNNNLIRFLYIYRMGSD